MSRQLAYSADEIASGRNFQGNHSDLYRNSGSVEKMLQERYMPRPSWRLEFEPGEIVLEVFSRQEIRKEVHSWDPFLNDGRGGWVTGFDTIRSGNRTLSWPGGGAEYLQSSFDVDYAGPGLSADVVRMFDNLGRLPGTGICLNKETHEGKIVDLFALREYEGLWERLRRYVLQIKQPIKIGHPGMPVVIKFRDAVEETTFEWHMRTLLDSNFERERTIYDDTGRACKEVEINTIVRNFQHADDIRSRAELAATGKVRAQFVDGWQERALMQDLALRRQQLPNPERFAYSGYITPELAGTTESPADFTSIVINPFASGVLPESLAAPR